MRTKTSVCAVCHENHNPSALLESLRTAYHALTPMQRKEFRRLLTESTQSPSSASSVVTARHFTSPYSLFPASD